MKRQLGVGGRKVEVGGPEGLVPDGPLYLTTYLLAMWPWAGWFALSLRCFHEIINALTTSSEKKTEVSY